MAVTQITNVGTAEMRRLVCRPEFLAALETAEREAQRKRTGIAYAWPLAGHGPEWVVAPDRPARVPFYVVVAAQQGVAYVVSQGAGARGR